MAAKKTKETYDRLLGLWALLLQMLGRVKAGDPTANAPSNLLPESFRRINLLNGLGLNKPDAPNKKEVLTAVDALFSVLVDVGRPKNEMVVEAIETLIASLKSNLSPLCQKLLAETGLKVELEVACEKYLATRQMKAEAMLQGIRLKARGNLEILEALPSVEEIRSAGLPEVEIIISALDDGERARLVIACNEVAEEVRRFGGEPPVISSEMTSETARKLHPALVTLFEQTRNCWVKAAIEKEKQVVAELNEGKGAAEKKWFPKLHANSDVGAINERIQQVQAAVEAKRTRESARRAHDEALQGLKALGIPAPKQVTGEGFEEYVAYIKALLPLARREHELVAMAAQAGVEIIPQLNGEWKIGDAQKHVANLEKSQAGWEKAGKAMREEKRLLARCETLEIIEEPALNSASSPQQAFNRLRQLEATLRNRWAEVAKRIHEHAEVVVSVAKIQATPHKLTFNREDVALMNDATIMKALREVARLRKEADAKRAELERIGKAEAPRAANALANAERLAQEPATPATEPAKADSAPSVEDALYREVRELAEKAKTAGHVGDKWAKKNGLTPDAATEKLQALKAKLLDHLKPPAASTAPSDEGTSGKLAAAG